MPILKAVMPGFSILIAGIIGILRFEKIGKIYYPFIFCIWLGSANEILRVLVLETGHRTFLTDSVYALAANILFSFFFRNIGVFGKSPGLFRALIITLPLGLCVEILFPGKATGISSWLGIAYSFCMIQMSISAISQLLFQDVHVFVDIKETYMVKNPVFLICVGSLIYFIVNVLVGIFSRFRMNPGKELRINTHEIIGYLNIAINLVYALAVLWMRPKQQYIDMS